MLGPLFSRRAAVRLALSAVAVVSATAFCHAQGLGLPDPSIPDASLPEASGVRVSGSLTVTADFYGYDASPDSAQKGRRPAQLYRFMFTPTIDFGGDFSLPINLNFLTPETNTMTPAVPSPSLPQILQNPANAFGLSSITPRLKWAQFHLGSHQPQYSQLTAGDQPLFGAGFDLTPGDFRLSASAGATQRAVAPDTALAAPGAFRRDQYMARIGWGREGGSMISLNAVYARDDRSSISSDIVRIAPERRLVEDTSVVVPPDTLRLRAVEGVVASLSAKAVLLEGIDLSGEAAVSSYTRDLTADVMEVKDNPLGSLLTTRASTRFDAGGNAALTASFPTWGVKLSGLYLGAGFVPIGYAFAQADRLEISVAPYVNLFESALRLRGSIGQRVNNLSSTAGETARHLIGSAGVDATIGDALSISAQYSNYGVRNDQVGDTLKVQNVTQSLSIDPTLTLTGFGASHTLTTSLALDTYDDYNVLTGAQSSNDTRTALASYTANFDSIPLNLGLIASYIENRLFEGDLIVRSIGINAGYALFDRAVEPRASITFGSSTFGAAPSDAQMFFKAGVRLRAGELVGVTIDVGSNQYEYGDPIPRGASFGETLAQISLTTQF
ncbi:MAG TPA: hypothetical protein VNA88_13760 [Candidatus Kapabacteria bacterium]|nr:hypothetical protein [Candidatus Kapabacteria bacterium]